MSFEGKDLFAQAALSQIPKILTLLDRNPHSPTYGCFDRNYWHYKIIDFPSGMAQEFMYPLALAFDTDLENNEFYQAPAVREWVSSALSFAAKSTHKNGSCDDYFPFEQASGAAAFSLLACIESSMLLKISTPEIVLFMEKRADWLSKHEESGRLTNHHALTILALERLSEMFNTDRWKSASRQRLEKILSWQHDEGWFPEYEGFDPGYHTLTVSCLSRIYQAQPDNSDLKNAITKAVKLSNEFIHPDGSFGGEYGSRNTYNFFPHGFELAGKWLPEALNINDRFLEGLKNGLTPCYEDDHIIGHHAWNYLLAWQDFVKERPEPLARTKGRIWLEGAKILIDRRDNLELYAGLNKGGTFKLFKNNKLCESDTQFSVQIKQGHRVKNAVGHLSGPYGLTRKKDTVIVRGQLAWAKAKLMTPAKLVILRAVMLTAGRFFPNLIRKILQRILITGRQEAPIEFKRTFEWKGGKLHIKDELTATSWKNVLTVGIGHDQTSTYTVMSRTFQKGHLAEWIDLSDQLKTKSDSKPITLERTF